VLDCQARGSRFLFHAQPYYVSVAISQWIPETVQNLEVTYGKEERVKRKGADTLVAKKETRKKFNDTGTEKKTGKH